MVGMLTIIGQEGVSVMALRVPLVVSRSLRLTGEQIVTWRKLQGLTAEQVAERAGISRNTLRSIEKGTGNASSENLFRVLNIIGVLRDVVAASDPYTTDVGRLRSNETLPQRVRPPS